MKPPTLLAYHFTGNTLRDGRPVPKVNTWLTHEGPVVPCQSGLHASLHPFDALIYAPGKWLHLVKRKGDIQRHNNDKVVGRHRKIVKSIDAEGLLRDFARWNALQVIHLWKAPDVVKRYLETGDDSLQDVARDAAWDAAGGAARAAARAAAWAAAWDAAGDAAWDAAWGAQAEQFLKVVSGKAQGEAE